jgi:poly(3-hydroxybutyrate) depolymerase
VAFDVEVPDSCAAGGCGAILDVHGWSMNGPMEDRHTRMRALAGPKGFVIVQPTAPGSPPSWTDGNPLGHNFPFDGTVWGFFAATLQRFGADPDRVHMLGFSQGGMMTNRFLYAHGDTFASMAPVSGPDGFATLNGTVLQGMDVQPPPANKVPVFYMHGTRDALLKFDKTALPYKSAIIAAYGLGAAETIKSETGLRGEKYAVDGRTMFEWYDHDYAQDNIYIAGHCITGPITDGDGKFTDQDKTPYRCLTDADHPTIDFDLGAEILRFFTEHPRGK